MRARRITFAALVVAAGLSLTACQNEDDATGASDPSSASSASAASSSGGGSGSGGSAGTDSDGKDTAGGSGSGSGSDSGGNATTPKCTTDGLKITAQDNFIDGDPDGTVVVALTNGSGADCVISGFAGVDLKTNAGGHLRHAQGRAR